MTKVLRYGGTALAVLVLLLVLLGLYLGHRPLPSAAGATPPPKPFSHVFVIMMENHGIETMSSRNAPYIHHLMSRYGYDPQYFGVTHVSLPNYVAFLSGRTFGTHSDNPNQVFSGPTLASQLDLHHIGWQAAMESLPKPGYQGDWYPGGARASIPPPTALYAKKHNPFLLFPALAKRDGAKVVPLSTLASEMAGGSTPSFVWITPNLCDDMHGQYQGPGATCPASQGTRLIRHGDQFLENWVTRIMHSSAWNGNAVIFITWDESETSGGALNLPAWKSYLAPGPASPRLLGIPIGGGKVPLIVISREEPKPIHAAVWADHVSLLKTIEAGFRLPYLGHAASPRVPLLTRFLPHR